MVGIHGGVGIVRREMKNVDIGVKVSTARVVLLVGKHAGFIEDARELGRLSAFLIGAARRWLKIIAGTLGQMLDFTGTIGDDRAVLIVHGELDCAEAVELQAFAGCVSLFIIDPDFARANHLRDLGVLVGLLPVLERDRAVERDIHVLAFEPSVVLEGLHAAVEVGVLAVEGHVLRPVNREPGFGGRGLAPLERGVARHVHGADPLDFGDVLLLVDGDLGADDEQFAQLQLSGLARVAEDIKRVAPWIVREREASRRLMSTPLAWVF